MFILCSIKDKKAEVFNQIIQLKNKAVAIREFETLVTDEKSPLNKFSKDYALYALATYDENTGEIQVLKEPTLVAEAEELIQKK